MNGRLSERGEGYHAKCGQGHALSYPCGATVVRSCRARAKLPGVKGKEAARAGWGWLWACLVWFSAFATAYAFTNPPGEAPDENGHLAYANYLAQHRELPVQTDPTRHADQGHHFPLYYLMAATVIRVVDGNGRVDPGFEPNPVFIAYGGGRGDVPRFLSRPDNGDLGAFRTLRMLSVFFGALTVLLVGLAARQLMPDGPWMLAPAFVAGLPQFQFVSSAVSNDSTMAATAALAIWMLLRALEKPEAKRWVALGLALGLAIWAKKSNLVLVPAGILAALAAPGQGGYWKAVALRWSAVLVPVLIVAGPLFLRQQIVYGDALGNAMERATLPQLVDPKPITDRYFVRGFPSITARSFVAHFGWMNVAVPTLSIAAHWILSLLLGLLSLTGLFDRGRRVITLALLATVVFAVAGLTWYNLTYTQAQGRLLYPALAAMAILLALGADRLKTWRPVIWIALAIWLAVDVVGFVTNLRFYGR